MHCRLEHGWRISLQEEDSTKIATQDWLTKLSGMEAPKQLQSLRVGLWARNGGLIWESLALLCRELIKGKWTCLWGVPSVSVVQTECVTWDNRACIQTVLTTLKQEWIALTWELEDLPEPCLRFACWKGPEQVLSFRIVISCGCGLSTPTLLTPELLWLIEQDLCKRKQLLLWFLKYTAHCISTHRTQRTGRQRWSRQRWWL